MKIQLAVICCDIRSAHNVGSIFRSCDAFGVKRLYLCGVSPWPPLKNDGRLPYLAAKNGRAIAKTALGAEKSVAFEYQPDASLLIRKLKNDGWRIIALEQAANSQPLRGMSPSGRVALLLGEEVRGLPQALLDQADTIAEIRMRGHKESLNVAVAAGIALYQLTGNSQKG
ncbi:MAG: TrmH family RNA methyltransferase [Candidatus Chaera renei]|uniref:TrmH family RNA methyltransferase n=1 Tax=Candidatus Chaera renei TaxID=2506947 RepID=A0A4Q0AIV0_9BACT|nr:MAG: TrmH family RNA methyltransferase [Candidatus Chaera renei]